MLAEAEALANMGIEHAKTENTPDQSLGIQKCWELNIMELVLINEIADF